jgi:hypothetical protein
MRQPDQRVQVDVSRMVQGVFLSQNVKEGAGNGISGVVLVA